MRILFISTLYPVKSGHYSSEVITHALHNFVREWSKHNEVRVIRPLITNINPLKPFHYYPKHIVSPGEYVLDSINISAVPVYRIPKTEILLTQKLERSIRDSDFRPDVIIAHFGRSIIIGAKMAKKTNLPFICGIHITDINHLKVENHFKQVLLNSIASSVACACRAPHILNSFSNMNISKPEIIFPAYSGISPSLITKNFYNTPKYTDLFNSENVIISTASTLIKRKNIDIILQALALLDCNWEFHIAGDGKESESLRNLASVHKISDKVVFHGLLSHTETLKIMSSSHLFVLPSANETFGTVYLEAMATGNIVIGSKGCGIDGIIHNGINGYLVTPGSIKELSETLEEILFKSSREKLQTILRASFGTVSGMTSEEMAKKYLSSVQKAIKANKSSKDL